MSKTAIKVGIIATVGSLVVYGVSKAAKLQQLNKHLVVKTTVQTPKAGLMSGISIPIKVTLENPTSTAITIKKPYVRLQKTLDLSEAPMLSSNVSNEEITIEAHSSTPFDILIQETTFNAATLIKDIIAAIKGDGLELYAISIVSMKTPAGFVQVPVEPTHFNFNA